jgi:hypothetical protein
VPESLLTILKFCFLALLYLFLLRVVRAVWAEVAGPRATRPPPGAAATAAPGRGRRDRGSAKGVLRLKVVEPPEHSGRAYGLADELTVGRAAGCQITLDDTYASQLHARIFTKDGQLFVEDLGSTNGTYLNRKKVTAPVPLHKGDRLQVGKTVMELSR